MANYSSKMRVFQNWGAPATGTVGEQNVFVFGPKYSLSRYTDETEREQIKPVAFNSDGVKPVTIEGAVTVAANYQLESLEVFAENAFVSVFAIDPANLSVSGEYIDGKLLYRGKLDGVKEGDYFYYVDSKGVGNSFRISTIDEVEDAEYGGDTVWTELTLVYGLDDSFEDGVPSGVKMCIARNVESVKLNDSAVSHAGADVTISPSGAVFVDDENRDLLEADLYMSTKSLYTGTSAGIQLASGISEVESVLGPADPENPISMGVYNAFIGGANVVYYYVTEGTTVAAFNKALDRATLNSTLYYLVPMSQDKAVIDAVVAHVNALSNEDVKRWRVCVACLNTDTSSVKDDVSVVANGSYVVQGVSFKTLKFSGDVENVVDGDKIKVGDTVFVAARLLNKTTVLTTTVADDNQVTGAAEITHVLTSSEYVDAVATAAKNVPTFRFVDVFPKTYGYGGETYSSMYLAPIIAGLASSVEPQAPITNATVPGVDDLPDIYNGYSTSELDRIAAGGVLIVAQDQVGERCYVRKQLTTGTRTGVLAQTELSMVKNYDSISHFFDTILEGFKGGFNVTDGILQRVWTELTHGVYILQNNGSDPAIGPQLLASSAVQRVEIDPANRTKINAYIDCDLPAPFNDMDLYLSVVTTDVAPVVPEA